MTNNRAIAREIENALPMLLVPAAAIGFYMASAPLAHGVINSYTALTAPRLIVIQVPPPAPVHVPVPVPVPPAPVPMAVPVPTREAVHAPAAPKLVRPAKHKTLVPEKVLLTRPHIFEGEDDMVEGNIGGSHFAMSIHVSKCPVPSPEHMRLYGAPHCDPGPPPPKIYGPIFHDEYGLAHSHPF